MNNLRMPLPIGETMLLVAGTVRFPLDAFLLLNEIEPEKEKVLLDELLSTGEYLFDRNTEHETLVQVIRM